VTHCHDSDPLAVSLMDGGGDDIGVLATGQHLPGEEQECRSLGATLDELPP